MDTNKPYQVCARCVMDSSAEEIRFNPDGTCNYCTRYFEQLPKVCKFNEYAEGHLANLAMLIKDAAKGSEFDCIIGLSGGVDSSYTAYIVKEKMGLNPLAVTLDNGWNTPEAEHNVAAVADALKLTLRAHVIAFEEMKSLQLAYMRASVLNLEAISDHAIVALLWHSAFTYKAPYILTGHNFQTEYILPYSWRYPSTDLTNILDIHRKHGNNVQLKTFPTMSVKELAHYQNVVGIKIDYPLNYLPKGYDKAVVKEFLKQKLGWHDYGSKHGESIITRFFQGYILPSKWNIDKRRCHLSTLICSGQITRDNALAELDKLPYPSEMVKADIATICNKWEICHTELFNMLDLPNRQHTEFATDQQPSKLTSKFQSLRKKIGL